MQKLKTTRKSTMNIKQQRYYSNLLFEQYVNVLLCGRTTPLRQAVT